MRGGWWFADYGEVRLSPSEARTLQLYVDAQRFGCPPGEAWERFERKAKALIDACERVAKWKHDHREGIAA
jgi:hypothetical protein